MRKGLLLVLAFTAACAGRQSTPQTPVSNVPSSAETVAFTARGDATDVCEALRAPGALPSIKPADQGVRILAFGDFGDGSPNQMQTAQAMVKYSQDHPFDFGITLGDNFYRTGLPDPMDRDGRWRREWEILYNPLGVRLYATLGNHDYYDPASPAGEIERSKHSPSWCLPRHYYTYTAGPVQFFAIDTDVIDRQVPSRQEQLRWLDEALNASTARWKVVYGHHPVYSTGSEHGDTPAMIRELLPLLKRHEVDLYFAGHDHDVEYLKPEGNLHFFVSGAGGHDPRKMGTDTGRRKWAMGKTLGFAVLEADQDAFTVSFFKPGSDRSPVQLCRVKIAKGQPDDDSECPP